MCGRRVWWGGGVSGLHGMPWLLLGLGCAFSLIRGAGWGKTRASRATNSRSLQDVESQWNDNYATTWQSDSSSVLCFRCILYGRLLNIVLLQPTPVVVFVLLLSLLGMRMYIYICMCEACICKLMASVCLWRVSMQHAHSAQSQNSQIRWKSFLTFNDARTVSLPPLTSTSTETATATATATSSKWANVFSWDLRKVSAKSFLSFRLLAKRQRQRRRHNHMAKSKCCSAAAPNFVCHQFGFLLGQTMWQQSRTEQSKQPPTQQATNRPAPACIINSNISLVTF